MSSVAKPATVPFFTPVIYGEQAKNWRETATESADTLFGIGGQHAYYEPNRGFTLEENTDPWYVSAGKIGALLTPAFFLGRAIKTQGLIPSKIFRKEPGWSILSLFIMGLFIAKVYLRSTSTFPICGEETTPKVTQVNIPDADKSLLNQLFVDVDKLPVGRPNAIDNPKLLTHPVMKCAYFSDIPFIVIHIHSLTDINTEATLAFYRQKNCWTQHVLDWNKSPIFFPEGEKFIDMTGQLVPAQKENFERLKQFIAKGYYQDEENGGEWEIVGHSKKL